MRIVGTTARTVQPSGLYAIRAGASGTSVQAGGSCGVACELPLGLPARKAEVSTEPGADEEKHHDTHSPAVHDLERVHGRHDALERPGLLRQHGRIESCFFDGR